MFQFSTFMIVGNGEKSMEVFGERSESNKTRFD
jgi:hypothetical protein